MRYEYCFGYLWYIFITISYVFSFFFFLSFSLTIKKTVDDSLLRSK